MSCRVSPRRMNRRAARSGWVSPRSDDVLVAVACAPLRLNVDVFRREIDTSLKLTLPASSMPNGHMEIFDDYIHCCRQ